MNPEPSGRRPFLALCPLLAALAATLPPLFARYPPLYDYYNWVFEGHVVAGLLRGASVGGRPVSAAYYVLLEPIPNLAAPLGIGLLNLFLPITDAGRAFLCVVSLIFGFGFLRLCRVAQGRPTPVELLGFPWAFGLFMYKGYVSYITGVGLAFFAIAALHVRTTRRPDGPRPRDLAVLATAGAGLYLCHLVGWALFALAVVVHSAFLLAKRRVREGALLAATLLPALLMLARYVRLREPSDLVYYDSLLGKGVSLLEAVLLFFRTDPLRPPFPIFWANVVGFALVAAIALGGRDRNDAWRVRLPLLLCAAAALLVGLVLPFHELGEMGRPDERVVLPAVLLLLATVPRYRTRTARSGVASLAVVWLLLGAHAFEYREASRELERVERETAGVIPRGASVVSLSIWGQRVHGACEPERFPSFGTTAMPWFGLQRVLERGGLKAGIMTTSFVKVRRATPGAVELVAKGTSSAKIRRSEGLGATYRPDFRYVEVFGCADDLAAAAEALSPEYAMIRQGEIHALFRRTRTVSRLVD